MARESHRFTETKHHAATCHAAKFGEGIAIYRVTGGLRAMTTRLDAIRFAFDEAIDRGILDPDDADYALHAVESHDGLVAALEAVVDGWDEWAAQGRIEAAIERARINILLAKGYDDKNK